jgi:hypothetical protein
MALATRLVEMKGNCGISGMEIEGTADYKLTSVTVGGANVDGARTYLVGVDTFIAGGGSGLQGGLGEAGGVCFGVHGGEKDGDFHGGLRD